MFRKRARLDPSQIEDRRGRSLGRGVAVGGGGIGIILGLLLIILNLSGGGSGSTSVEETLRDLAGVTVGHGSTPDDLSHCRTGADAEKSEDCRIVAFVNSIQSYWQDEFSRSGRQYRPARTFHGSAGTYQRQCSISVLKYTTAIGQGLPATRTCAAGNVDRGEGDALPVRGSPEGGATVRSTFNRGFPDNGRGSAGTRP